MNRINNIYKVHLVKGGDKTLPSKVIVFYGENDTELKELFMSDPNNKKFLDSATGNPIFSQEELERIKTSNIDVIFSKQTIYLDDTILSIKIKILIELINMEEVNELSIDELFLFCMKSETMLPQDMYNTLTQKRRVVLSRQRLENTLQNIKGSFAEDTTNISLIDDKEYYSYDDLLKLDIFDKDVNVVRMLGQKLFLIDSHYPFPYNPFDMKFFDNLLYTASVNATSTMNSNLLLDNGIIVDNIIYLTTAQYVLEYHSTLDNPLNEQYLLSVYFPSLTNNGITSVNHLIEKRSMIMTETNNLISEATKNIYTKEDMLHRVSKTEKERNMDIFEYDAEGIMEIRFAIQQTFEINAPLDIIFKLIHVDKNILFTKLNPGTQREPMYRLFGEQKTKDHRVIPSLTKTKSNQLSSSIGKSKSVAAYIQIHESPDIDFVCEFQENGDMIININSPDTLSLTQVNDFILRYANPYMKQIADFLSDSGYKFNLFTGLYEQNIDILYIKYGYDVHIKNYDTVFDIKNVQKCLIPAFIINSFNVSGRDGANMRYKKVSNFNKMTSKEAFVIEQVKRREGYQGDALLENLMEAHDIDENEAREIIARVAAHLTIDTGGIGSKTKRIRSNPGFPVKITDITKKSLKTKRKIRIEVSGIDNIFYIQCLETYINSLISLSVSYKDLTSIIQDLETVCSLTQNESLNKEDILSARDKNIVNTQELVIENDKVQVVDNAQPIVYHGDEETKTVNALDLIYGSDDDYEDYDDYEDDTYDEDMEGGSHSKNRKSSKRGGETVSNIIGMRLTKPNPFVKIMEEADKDLFLVKGDGKEKFVKYSTKCDSAYGRQPVLMTLDEYKNNVEHERNVIIDKYGRDEFYSLSTEQQQAIIEKETQLDDRFIVTYGSSREKRNVYACPRYWCMKTNSYIHPSEMRQKMDENGKPMVNEKGQPVLQHPTCGGIIPRGSQSIKDDGNFVFEFTGQNRISSKTGEYLANYPSFLPRDKHPTEKCLPCCFKFNVDKNGNLSRPDGRINTNMECMKDIEEVQEDKNNEERKENKQENVFQPAQPKGDALYILDQATTPVHLGRWGFAPIEVQYLLKEYSSDYLADLPRMQIKEDIVVLLRHGVETESGKNHPQHFLSAMADVMFYNDPNDRKTLQDFKKYLISKLTIERFAKYQNGNLINDFYTDIDIDNQDIEPYKSSQLYSSTNEKSFRKLARAFDNFKAFLIINTTNIDHTYMWDFICDSEIHDAHPNGINLIILDIPEDDGTTKVEIICPTNHYSSLLYNRDKPSVILIKRHDIYEPIYSLKKTTNSIVFQKYFAHEQSSTPMISGEMTPNSILTFLDKVINPIYQNKCTPMSSLRREYNFKKPILLGELLRLLTQIKSIKVEVIRHVLNYSYKTIAIEVKIGEDVGIIPCYPSGNKMSKDTQHTFIDDDSIYKDYNETIAFMNKVVYHTKGRIPISPSFKLVDDEMIVGIITITNQVILINKPFELNNVNDDIPIIRHKGYTRDNNNPAKSYIDINITNNNSFDTDRREYVNKIKLETNFFNAFRNTIRILLHDYINLEIREQIEKTINSMVIYSKKLETVTNLIQKLIKNHIRFKDNIDLTTLKTVSLCINADKTTCSERNPVCIMEERNKTEISLNTLQQEEKEQEQEQEQEQQGGTELFQCVLIIPKKNLLTPSIDNEIVYLYKIADQLLRYTRIRSYLLDTTQFLGISDIDFNIYDTEVILSQSSLKNDYFNNLVPYINTGYGNKNSIDTVNPSYMTTEYLKEYDYNKIIEMDPFAAFSSKEQTENSNSPEKKKLLIKRPIKLETSTKIIDDNEQ